MSSETTTPDRSRARDAARDLTFSLALIGGLILFAAVGLALEHNWPKAARIALAYVTYASVLLSPRNLGVRSPVGFSRMALAAAAAGFVNGVVRPQTTLQLIAASTLLAATLLAGTHWLALRNARRLLDVIAPR
jgi:hypothetical protein